jgi:hypothetical protein
MSKKTATVETRKTNSYFEEDEDFLDAIEESIEQQDIEEVPDDVYEPEIPPPPVLRREGRPMIVREIRPDNLTTVRRRVVLTKSMCRRKGCNYDAVRDMGTRIDNEGKIVLLYNEWKRVPPTRREECLQYLSNHMAIAHSANDEHIVFESDIQTEWFGTDVYTGRARNHR